MRLEGHVGLITSCETSAWFNTEDTFRQRVLIRFRHSSEIHTSEEVPAGLVPVAHNTEEQGRAFVPVREGSGAIPVQFWGFLINVCAPSLWGL